MRSMQVERMRRSVAKEPMERIRRSPAAPQGAFGVVDRSGEILADAAQKAAAQFEIVAKRRQEDWDKAKVNEAVSRYLKWDQETRFDPQKGLMFTTGANAKGLFERSLDMYEKQAEALGGELENERQRTMFREAVIPHERAATFALSRQESTEVRKWNAEQAEERLKNEAAALAAGFDSPEAVDAAIASARQVNLTINGDQGIETNDKNETDVMRRLVAYGLDSLVKSDPLRAEAMLERFKSIYDGVSYEKLRDAVSKAALPVKAQGEAERLLSEFGADGMTEALAAVREAHGGPEAEDYAKYVKSVFGEAKAARAERETEAFDNIVGMIRRGEPLHRINEAIEAVPWARKATVYQLEDMRDRRFGIGAFAPDGSGGGRIKSDPAAVRELTDLKATGKLTERFPTWESFREAYESRLAPSKYEEYANIWLDASGKKRSREAAHINANAARYADHFIEKYRIREEGKQALFRDEMNRSLDAHRAKYGKEPTHSELYQMAETLGEEIVIGTGRFGGEVKVRRYEIDTSDAQETTVVNGELWVKDLDSPSGWSRYRRDEME